MGIIYVATNKINGKKYVGQTRQPLRRRLSGHVYDSRHGCKLPFCRAIAKYGINGFDFEEFAFSDELLDCEEINFIARLKTNSPNGYNISNGGGGSLGKKYKMTEEHKSKIAAKRMGKKHTEETKKLIGALKIGKKLPKFTDEHIDALRKAIVASWNCRFGKYVFTDPQGNEHISENGFSKFCKERDIRRDMMERVMLGKVKQGHHRGWKVRKID